MMTSVNKYAVTPQLTAIQINILVTAPPGLHGSGYQAADVSPRPMVEDLLLSVSSKTFYYSQCWDPLSYKYPGDVCLDPTCHFSCSFLGVGFPCMYADVHCLVFALAHRRGATIAQAHPAIRWRAVLHRCVPLCDDVQSWMDAIHVVRALRRHACLQSQRVGILWCRTCALALKALTAMGSCLGLDARQCATGSWVANACRKPLVSLQGANGGIARLVSALRWFLAMMIVLRLDATFMPGSLWNSTATSPCVDYCQIGV